MPDGGRSPVCVPGEGELSASIEAGGRPDRLPPWIPSRIPPWVCPGGSGSLQRSGLIDVGLLERQQNAVQGKAVGIEGRSNRNGRFIGPVGQIDIYLGRDAVSQNIHGEHDVAPFVHTLFVVRAASRNRHAAQSVGSADGNVEGYLHDGIVNVETKLVVGETKAIVPVLNTT